MTTLTNYFNNDRTVPVPSLLGRPVWDELFDAFFEDPSTAVKRSTSGYPVTDIYRDDDGNSVVECALAGFSREDLNIEIQDNIITVSANHSGGETTENSRRIARRSFSKSFIDYENILNLDGASATFTNGLLQVTIPPVEESPVKKLVIE
jgi:HSP20 family molecular chaperone IbpA